MELGLVYSLVSFETKEFFGEAEKMGIALQKISDEKVGLGVGSGNGSFGIGNGDAGEANGLCFPETCLMRSISNSRSVYIAGYLEGKGKKAVNKSSTFAVCGDKALTSMALSEAGIPTPKTFISFSAETAKEAMGKVSYPCVIKPVVGSWGRLVHKINDSDAGTAVLEYKEQLQNPMHKIYYVQEYIEKPGRDIRAIACGNDVVAAMYRIAGEGDFRTNRHLGMNVQPCEVTPEISEICAKVGSMLGGEEVLGIDLVETDEGLKVIEVNHTPEFAGCQKATGVKIAGKMLEHVKGIAKN